jgi:hypothetical protein
LQVDVSIIEVGLGGRNDSTNVVFIFPQNHHLIIIIIINYYYYYYYGVLQKFRTLMEKENAVH